jgi:ferritin-like metal-binding protein YciE
MNKLRVLFLNELADMYDTEKRIIKALPKLARAATCKQLKAAFLSHLEETKEHKVKIRQVFKEFGEKPRGRRCAATIGLIKEGEKAAVENKGQPTINAALVSIGQKVEHYEIASFGCLHEWAKLLQKPRVARIIEEILTQEKTCDEALKELANAKNQEALDASHEFSGNTPRRAHLRSRKKMIMG